MTAAETLPGDLRDPFAPFHWVDATTIVWNVRPGEHAPEYLHVIFADMRALIAGKEEVGVVIDLRDVELPNVAARATIRTHLMKIRPQLRGMALVLDTTPTSRLMGHIARVIVSNVVGLRFRIHNSVENAVAWLSK